MADNSSDTSFLSESKGSKLHIKDILFIVLRNLHWLVICGAIGAFISGYSVRHQNRVYFSNARVLIKGSSTGSSENTMREASIKSMFSTRSLYNSSLNNEMQIMVSKSAIREVATNLKLNISYTTKTRIVGRTKDLYGESPFTVDFVDNDDESSFAFNVSLGDNERFTVAMDNYEPLAGRFEDTLATPVGRIVLHKTWFYHGATGEEPILVRHESMSAVVDHYRAALQVVRDDDMNTLVTHV